MISLHFSFMHAHFMLYLTLGLLSGADGGRHGGGRGHRDALSGTTVKIRQGPFKGYRGRVVEVKGQSVRVELESQMKVVTGVWLMMTKIWLY